MDYFYAKTSDEKLWLLGEDNVSMRKSLYIMLEVYGKEFIQFYREGQLTGSEIDRELFAPVVLWNTFRHKYKGKFSSFSEVPMVCEGVMMDCFGCSGGIRT
ncbi:hypothetical protein [Bacillus toyonensis]|uniref:hypothetical protein n=1 Tax=Bacillus toyonensis TaxID=155322 RepID=UPI002E1E3B8A|nr:hypothetical protein [Bacillus toyonensis]